MSTDRIALAPIREWLRSCRARFSAFAQDAAAFLSWRRERSDLEEELAAALPGAHSGGSLGLGTRVRELGRERDVLARELSAVRQQLWKQRAETLRAVSAVRALREAAGSLPGAEELMGRFAGLLDEVSERKLPSSPERGEVTNAMRSAYRVSPQRSPQSEEARAVCLPPGDGTRIDRAFLAFHAANPDVYIELVALAREAHARGRRRLGMKMLWEVVRWKRFLRTTDNGASVFKLNNNYHSRYARLIALREPDLAGLFELRELRS